MMHVSEVLDWIRGLPADIWIGIDDGGLTLETVDGESWLEIGGLPEAEDVREDLELVEELR